MPLRVAPACGPQLSCSYFKSKGSDPAIVPANLLACAKIGAMSFVEVTSVISLEGSIRTALASFFKSVKCFAVDSAFVSIEAEIPPGRTYGGDHGHGNTNSCSLYPHVENHRFDMCGIAANRFFKLGRREKVGMNGSADS